MIEFREVTVRYAGALRPALQSVSIAAPRGSLTAVVGPNGSGKSTLVRALIGRQPLAGGDVRVDGVPVAQMDRVAIARRIAIVTQREDAVFSLPVRDYVAMGRYPHIGGWRGLGAADHVAIDRAASLTDLHVFMDRRLDTLSGGEWQRVRLARAIAQGGDAIVLDEPTTFLDIAHEMQVFELLSRLAHVERLAVLLVSHQLNLVARFADHIVLLHEGTVAAAGTAHEVMRGEVLERVYQWPLVVSRDPAVGAPALVPLRRR
ncbi:MAG: ABC transporter ATP-binding protein [Gemmatimonadaceae bacterium]|nr:ABC transporter ATP-binding protein [Gemmatimonadaceae bacterium]